MEVILRLRRDVRIDEYNLKNHLSKQILIDSLRAVVQ